jgi:hypothetical protein
MVLNLIAAVSRPNQPISDNSPFEHSMPITVQFEESCDRTTPDEAYGGSEGVARPHSRAVPVSQPVKASESHRFQEFAASVKEKKEALEQESLADQDAERFVRGEDTEDEGEIFPETSVTEVCASK